MKKRALFIVLSVTAVSYAASPAFGDDPQWKLEITGSDHAGYSVLYSWPGEGKEPLDCTVTARVKYSMLGRNGGRIEEFRSSNKIHNTGNGWAYFDGKAGLDSSPPLDMSILDHSCH